MKNEHNIQNYMTLWGTQQNKRKSNSKKERDAPKYLVFFCEGFMCDCIVFANFHIKYALKYFKSGKLPCIRKCRSLHYLEYHASFTNIFSIGDSFKSYCIFQSVIFDFFLEHHTWKRHFSLKMSSTI